MEIKKWMPWNWFEKEEKDTGKTVPVQRKMRRIRDLRSRLRCRIFTVNLIASLIRLFAVSVYRNPGWMGCYGQG